jgi:hypothetical protein
MEPEKNKRVKQDHSNSDKNNKVHRNCYDHPLTFDGTVVGRVKEGIGYKIVLMGKKEGVIHGSKIDLNM